MYSMLYIVLLIQIRVCLDTNADNTSENNLIKSDISNENKLNDDKITIDIDTNSKKSENIKSDDSLGFDEIYNTIKSSVNAQNKNKIKLDEKIDNASEKIQISKNDQNIKINELIKSKTSNNQKESNNKFDATVTDSINADINNKPDKIEIKIKESNNYDNDNNKDNNNHVNINIKTNENMQTHLNNESPTNYNNTVEKCYVIISALPNDSSSMVDDLASMIKQVKYVYKKNVMGFSFCTKNPSLVDNIKQKYLYLNIEEDKVYKLASINEEKNDINLNKNININNNEHNNTNNNERNNMQINSDNVFGKINSDNLNNNNHTNANNKNNNRKYSRYHFPNNSKQNTDNNQFTTTIYTNPPISNNIIPLYIFRIINMGNLYFNNYFLDNIFFRIFHINYLIKYFNNYFTNRIYTGRGVNISAIDANSSCNNHSSIIAQLLHGNNSFSRDAKLSIINAVNCDGTIKLSALLHALENTNALNSSILLLPFSGPHSNILDNLLSRLSEKIIIITASGNNSDNSCNYSPNGHNIIKVGSVSKHGYTSKFSNIGDCNNIYALGENVDFNNSSWWNRWYVNYYTQYDNNYNDQYGGAKNFNKNYNDDYNIYNAPYSTNNQYNYINRHHITGTSYSAAITASSIAVYLSKYPGSSIGEVIAYLGKNSLRNSNRQVIVKEPFRSLNDNGRDIYTYYGIISVVFFNIITISLITLSILYMIMIWKQRRAESLRQPQSLY